MCVGITGTSLVSSGNGFWLLCCCVRVGDCAAGGFCEPAAGWLWSEGLEPFAAWAHSRGPIAKKQASTSAMQSSVFMTDSHSFRRDSARDGMHVSRVWRKRTYIQHCTSEVREQRRTQFSTRRCLAPKR
jgi:hypothetical protein